jgi:deoxyribodipyrimidine photo-lyase
VIDTSYEALGKLAQSAKPVYFRAGALSPAEGIPQPELSGTPFGMPWAEPDSAEVVGRDIWLHHPWSLGASPNRVGPGSVSIAVGFVESHAQNPWSERRWSFVSDGLRAQSPHLWWGSVLKVAQSLRGARSVSWQPDPHVNSEMAQLQVLLQTEHGRQIAMPQPRPCLFEPVAFYCQSFTQWWRQTRIA